LLVVFVLHGNLLVYFELSEPVHGLWVGVGALARQGMVHLRTASGIKHVLSLAHMAHRRLVHHVDWRGRLAARGADAVERDQTNLIVRVKRVLVVLVKQHLQQSDLSVHSH